MVPTQTEVVKQNIQKAQAATDAQLEFKYEQAKEGSTGGWDYHSSVVQQSRVYEKGPNKVQPTYSKQGMWLEKLCRSPLMV